MTMMMMMTDEKLLHLVQCGANFRPICEIRLDAKRLQQQITIQTGSIQLYGQAVQSFWLKAAAIVKHCIFVWLPLPLLLLLQLIVISQTLWGAINNKAKFNVVYIHIDYMGDPSLVQRGLIQQEGQLATSLSLYYEQEARKKWARIFLFIWSENVKLGTQLQTQRTQTKCTMLNAESVCCYWRLVGWCRRTDRLPGGEKFNHLL